MADHENVFRIIDAVACLVSLLSCFGLVCFLRRLPGELRGRLFPRQALWLGLADIAYTAAKLTIHHLRLAIGTDVVDLCHHAWLVMITTNVTYLMEMFLCLGFAFQAAKSSAGLKMLKYSGVLSIVIGGLVVLTEPWWNLVGHPDFLMCQVVDTHTMDSAFLVLTIACLAISFLSFAFVLGSPHASSDAVHRRVVIRSRAYMIKTVAMTCPTLLVVFLFSVMGLNPLLLDFAHVANILQDLNGAANTMTYFFLSRYSRRRIIEHKSARPPVEESYHIAFESEVGVRMFTADTFRSTRSSVVSTDGSYEGSFEDSSEGMVELEKDCNPQVVAAQ